MTETFKVLGQSAPLATTSTDIYTVPAYGSATLSSIVVCNRSASATSFRINVAKGGVANSNEQYLYYDAAIAGNTTFSVKLGVTMATGDVMRVYATLATLSFSIFGVEVIG